MDGINALNSPHNFDVISLHPTTSSEAIYRKLINNTLQHHPSIMACPYNPEATPTFTPGQSQSTKEEKIPQPPSHYFIGNLADIDPTSNTQSFWQLADIYGEIYQLDLPGRKTIVCSSYELVNELCDPDRFEKAIMGPLEETRALLKDGLFTAYPGEHVSSSSAFGLPLSPQPPGRY
jgi:hypothetical protein